MDALTHTIDALTHTMAAPSPNGCPKPEWRPENPNDGAEPEWPQTRMAALTHNGRSHTQLTLSHTMPAPNPNGGPKREWRPQTRMTAPIPNGPKPEWRHSHTIDTLTQNGRSHTQ